MGVAGLFEDLGQQPFDFLELLLPRMQQFEIRFLGHTSGAAGHISPFIGENIPKKGPQTIFMVLIW